MAALVKTVLPGAAVFTIIAIVLSGCGGHSSGGTAPPPPGVPVISNLTATYEPGTCTVQRLPGKPLTVTLQYSDSDGDVKGGTLETTGTFLPSQQSVDVNFPLPSNSATLTGTTEGSITAFGCVAFNGSTGLILSVSLLDKAGHSSNLLTITINLEVARGVADHETGVPGLAMLRP